MLPPEPPDRLSDRSDRLRLTSDYLAVSTGFGVIAMIALFIADCLAG